MVSWGAALAGVRMRGVIVRASGVLPFALLPALAVFSTAGGPTVGAAGLELSLPGLWILAGVLMKSFVSASAVAVAVEAAGFEGLAAALGRFRVPALLVDTILLTWRYIHVLASDAAGLRRAAAARGFRPRWLPQAAVVGRLAGSLLVRSSERAVRVHTAMLARGYGLALPRGVQERAGVRDVAIPAAAILLIGLCRVLL
jgi:cobalt/nickel transport system permease protein